MPRKSNIGHLNQTVQTNALRHMEKIDQNKRYPIRKKKKKKKKKKKNKKRQACIINIITLLNRCYIVSPSTRHINDNNLIVRVLSRKYPFSS